MERTRLGPVPHPAAVAKPGEVSSSLREGAPCGDFSHRLQDATGPAANIAQATVTAGDAVDDSHADHVVTAYARRDDIVRSVTRRFGAGAEEHVAEAYARCCDASVRDADHAANWVALVVLP